MDMRRFIGKEEASAIRRLIAGGWRPAADINDWAVAARAVLLHDGVKLFRVDPEVFASYRSAPAPVRFRDYRQPFRALVIQYGPDDYVVSCSRPGVIVQLYYPATGHPHFVLLSAGGDRDATVEAQFTRDDAESDQRAVVALCMKFAEATPVRQGWLDPEKRARREKCGQDLKQGVEVYTLEQTIRMNPDRPPPSPPGEKTGREMPPHQRRGHWALVACGPGRTERKRVFKREAFVRKDKFKGDMGDTKVTYE